MSRAEGITMLSPPRRVPAKLRSLLASGGGAGGSAGARVLYAVLAVVAALGVGALVLTALGENTAGAYAALWDGSAGSASSLAQSLGTSTPLLLVALGVAISFRSGYFNIGAGGQLAMGALASALVGAYDGVGGVPGMIIMLLAGGAAGMLWGGISGVLRAYLGASEIVTTLMLNYVALELIDYLASGPLQVSNSAQTKSIPASTHFPSIASGTQLNFMFVVMIILVPALAVLLWRSSFGFRVRMSGLSQEAAEANGINTRVVGASALAISGLLAGVAGATQVGTTFWAMPQDFSIQIGFDAIAVALLGANSPIGILPAGLLLGGLLQGSSLMQFSSGVQGPFVEVLEALVILFVVAVPFLLNRLLRHRRQS